MKIQFSHNGFVCAQLDRSELTLFQNAFRSSFGYDLTPEQWRVVNHRIDHDLTLFALLEQNSQGSKIAGLGAVEHPAEKHYNPTITDIAIHPDYRDKKLSSILYAGIINFLVRETDYPVARVEVKGDNVPSQKAAVRMKFTCASDEYDRMHNFKPDPKTFKLFERDLTAIRQNPTALDLALLPSGT